MIRYIIDAHTEAIPAVLEIPSKDSPYDANKDSILRRAKVRKIWLAAYYVSPFWNYFLMLYKVRFLKLSAKTALMTPVKTPFSGGLRWDKDLMSCDCGPRFKILSIFIQFSSRVRCEKFNVLQCLKCPAMTALVTPVKTIFLGGLRWDRFN